MELLSAGLVQPLADVVSHYTSRDRNQKCNQNLQDFSPPPLWRCQQQIYSTTVFDKRLLIKRKFARLFCASSAPGKPRCWEKISGEQLLRWPGPAADQSRQAANSQALVNLKFFLTVDKKNVSGYTENSEGMPLLHCKSPAQTRPPGAAISWGPLLWTCCQRRLSSLLQM